MERRIRSCGVLVRLALSFDVRDKEKSVSPLIVGKVYVMLRGIGSDVVGVILVTAIKAFRSWMASSESRPEIPI